MRTKLMVLATLAACGDGTTPAIDARVAAADAAPDDAQAGDAGVDAPPDAAGCGTLAAMPAEVFVDSASVEDSIGTAACPFHAISEALALTPPDPANPRVVHVIGGVPARSYDEGVLFVLPPQLALVGDGEARLTLGGGGTCLLAAAICTVSVQRGARLSGLTVTSATGNAIEVGGGAGVATLDHVVASAALRNGILVRGDVAISNVVARDNKQDGVNAKTAAVTVTASNFINNAGDGLDIDQGAVLDLTGGLIHNNDAAGVFLHNGTSFTVLAHVVSAADIQQNLGFGIDVAGNASLKLRGTTMFQNEIGVTFQVGSANVLDVGTVADPGNNVFAGATAVNRNARAGLCFEQSPATQTQAAEGNSWQACPPPQRKITGPFCRSNNTYGDIAFVPAVTTSGAPVVPPATCAVGP